ncbi:MAG: LamG domain-containing protein [Planctomycetes bacterium]|nr:LamG domain-containing protein [Planctomycetota bacterium]
MCRKLIFMLLVLAFGLTVSAQATTIIWVSKNKTYGDVAGAAADQGWVDLLRANGYTVIYKNEFVEDAEPWINLNANKIAELQAADLIIFSRDDDSDNYNGDRQIWNEDITTPMINMYAKQMRDSRLDWIVISDEDRHTSNLRVQVPDHPIFAGVTLDGNNEIAILDTAPRMGVELTDSADAGNGIILATRAATDNRIWIAEWETGVEFYDGGFTTGGKRMHFAGGADQDEDGIYNFNTDGATIFLDAVAYMLTPVNVATNPSPKNGPRTAPTGVSGEGHWMAMTFDKGHGATTHTAYFSENFDDVNERNGDVLLGSSPYAPDPLYETYYYVGKNDPCYPIPEFAQTPLERGTTYYWVVDESNAVASYPGNVWSFTIATVAAWDPTPADDAININDTGVNLAWQKGDVTAMTIRYDVYWGTDEEMVAGRSDTPDAQVTDPTTTTPIGLLSIDTDYYWKVNTVVIPPSPPSLTIEGEVWHFKTKPVFPFTDDPNLLGWWWFDEVSGELALDHSGYANDGIITGGAQRVPGKIDKAIDVDGDNGKGVEIEFTTGWPVANPPELTVAMWVKPHVIDATDDDTIFFMDETGSNGKMRCRIHNGDWQFRHGNGIEAGNINSTGPAAILDEWTHYAGVRRDNDALYVYINGQFEDDSAFGVAGPLDPTECWIGAGDDGLGNPNNAFDGLIDDVRLYNRALSASEVAHLVDPALAYKPSPGDGEQDVPLSAKLTWTPGIDQSTGSPYTEHDVYFGTNFDAVDSATTPEATLTGDVNEHPVVLAYATDYYWRIDGVNAGGGAYKGVVWTFKTMYNPALPRDPDPNDGATGVPRNAVLSWTPGDYAPPSNGHYVYFGADDPANLDLVANQPQSPNNYSPGALNLGRTYYWAVDEANTAAPGGVDAGNIWTFTTIDHLVVDDMESYGDGFTPGQPGNCIFFVWRDGWTLNEADGFPAGFLSNNTGASIGNWDPPFAETTIVSGGRQSMPYLYDNDGEVHGGNNPANTPNPNNPLEYYSKGKAEISDLQPLTQIGPDWTVAGAKALSLQFYGTTGNAIEPMWVELIDGAGGNATVTYGDYDGENPTDINDPSWHQWNIDLQDFNDGGVDLTNVSSIAIGFGSATATTPGGSGVVYFDDIRLYPSRCVLAKRDPNFALLDYVEDCVVNYRELETMTHDWLAGDHTETGELLVHWAFNTGSGVTAADSSGKGRTGDISGADWVNDPERGSCLDFSGGDFVLDNDANAYLNGLYGLTISIWVKCREIDSNRGFIIFEDPSGDDDRDMRYDSAGANGGGINVIKCGMTTTATVGNSVQQLESSSGVQTTAWQHLALTWSTGEQLKLYINGTLDTPSANRPGTVGTLTGATKLIVGQSGKDEGAVDSWNGLIDDVRIYNYALSATEIATVKTGGSLPAKSTYYPLLSPAELYEAEPQGSKIVNFKDYAVLLNNWLDEGLFPPPSGR